MVIQVACFNGQTVSKGYNWGILFKFDYGIIIVIIGDGVRWSATPDFGVDGSWGFRETMLYHIMHRNMRWEHFPKWSLFKNRKICVC